MGIFWAAQNKSVLFNLLISSDKHTHCAHVYFCPSRSNLVSSAFVHNFRGAIVRLRGWLTALNLPPLTALFSTDVAAGADCSTVCGDQRQQASFNTPKEKMGFENDMMLILHRNMHHAQYAICYWIPQLSAVILLIVKGCWTTTRFSMGSFICLKLSLLQLYPVIWNGTYLNFGFIEIFSCIICNYLKFENCQRRTLVWKWWRGQMTSVGKCSATAAPCSPARWNHALIKNVSQVSLSCRVAHEISTMILNILSVMVSRQHRCMWLYLKIVCIAAEGTNISSQIQELKVCMFVLFSASGDWGAKNTFFMLSALQCAL